MYDELAWTRAYKKQFPEHNYIYPYKLLPDKVKELIRGMVIAAERHFEGKEIMVQTSYQIKRRFKTNGYFRTLIGNINEYNLMKTNEKHMEDLVRFIESNIITDIDGKVLPKYQKQLIKKCKIIANIEV